MQVMKDYDGLRAILDQNREEALRPTQDLTHEVRETGAVLDDVANE